jgi:hypothetical protein
MHHSKTAMALLCQKLFITEIDIALIQEPRFMGTEQGDYAIQGGHYFLLDLVLLLEPAFCQEHSSCLSAVRALSWECEDSKSDDYYRRQQEGTYCYLSIPPS